MKHSTGKQKLDYLTLLNQNKYFITLLSDTQLSITNRLNNNRISLNDTYSHIRKINLVLERVTLFISNEILVCCLEFFKNYWYVEILKVFYALSKLSVYGIKFMIKGNELKFSSSI